MIEALLAGLFGLLIGSFLNVCIYRLPRDLSAVRPRSFCPECEHMIAWHDNIPVLSYIVLGAKCRHCRANIPVRYPVVEILTGALFFLAVYLNGLSLPALKLCIFSAILIELSVSDLETLIVPDEFTLGGAAIGFVLSFFVMMDPGVITALFGPFWNPTIVSVAESLAGALFPSGTLYLVGKAYQKIRNREGLGFGDVKMIAMIGAFLGIHLTLITLVIGSIAGSLIGLALIFAMKKDAATYELPYGTFIGAGAVLVAFVGPGLL
jgi:leader peptidase (prepilin peptidase)/N-methyltransferase